jgi:DMSO/TMAO reductase YedYZ heme-binding membrane subunit
MNIEILNWPGLWTKEEVNQLELQYTCMGTTQGKSLCSYFYLKLARLMLLLLSFMFFSSTKWENRRAKQILHRAVDTSERGNW